MKRTIFLVIAVLCAATTLLAWSYSTNTTWNGSIHVQGSTSFTPSSTTAYLKMTAPTNANCPHCSGEYGPQELSTTKAILNEPIAGTTYTAQKQCGGCA